MLPQLMSLKSLFKLDEIKNDNNIFRLHYKVTVLFLALFATLTSLKQYVGDPIDCFVDGGFRYDLDTYCWIHSTFTLPNNPAGSLKNGAMPIPGMGTLKENEPIVYHKYYQWVGFFLIFSAGCFYVPRYVWKMCEAGKLRTILSEMTSVLMPSEVLEKNKTMLIDYLFANWNQHRIYAFSFFACEIVNFGNIIGQIFLLDVFLGGEFSTYGIKVIAESETDSEQRTDPMSRIFPTVTKCTFKNYGPSGTIQVIDAMCILPVNILNEKIFIFLWFWYIALAVLTGIAILFRIIILLSPPIRFYLLQQQAGKCRTTPNCLYIVFKHCHIGDWFLLMLIGQNVHQFVFQEIVEGLSDRLEGKTV